MLVDDVRKDESGHRVKLPEVAGHVDVSTAPAMSVSAQFREFPKVSSKRLGMASPIREARRTEMADATEAAACGRRRAEEMTDAADAATPCGNRDSARRAGDA